MLNEELIEKVKEDLVRHEGYITEIYLDSENLPTFGIGHLVTESDMEHTWPVGTAITDERILQVFNDDCKAAYSDACVVFLNLASHPEDVQRVCINMAFNLGRTRLLKFKKMISAVNEGNYAKAAEEMTDSKWYRQVKRRSKELVTTMQNAV